MSALRQPLKNKNPLRTYEMWKTTLQYKDLSILTSTGSYMRVFTVILNIFLSFLK